MPAHRGPHPALYLILYLPFGIAFGYVTVTLGWLLSNAGASVAAIAGLAGMGLLATRGMNWGALFPRRVAA
jgi:hypothetical protein